MPQIDTKIELPKKRCKKVFSNDKIAYIPIARNGTYTMKRILESVGCQKKDYYKHVEDLFTFTILRDPYERFFSIYLRAIDNVGLKKPEDFLKRMENTLESAKEGHFWNEHLFRQVDFLTNSEKNLINMNMWLYLESFEQDLKKLNNELGYDFQPRHDHKTLFPEIKKYLKGKITNRYKELIEEIYKEDFELYEKHKH